MTLEPVLARFTHAPVLGDPARAMMRLSLFDWAACGIAGQGEPVAQILRTRALGDGGAQVATLFGVGLVPPRAAALVNGATSHALDYDDTHFAHIGHPSVVVIPAALAIAQMTGAGFADLIDAALIGVEASIRVGLWLGRDHYEAGFHQTATAGAFGATLAAARLLRLTEPHTLAAIGICSTRASGLKSQFGTMGKPYNAGIAAETGVEAALLAQASMTSTDRGLSHCQGFGPTHHGQSDDDALTDLGNVWRFETVSHKFHACCHGLHAMIEAVGSLDLSASDVASVTIRTHPRWLTVCNAPEPQTGLGAKFSYRLTCAMVLAGVDTAAIGSYTDALTQRPDLVALRDRISVVADPRLSEMQAHVTVIRTDGTQVEARHDLDEPMSLSDRRAKLTRKAAGLLGQQARVIWTAIDRGDLPEFIAELSRAG